MKILIFIYISFLALSVHGQTAKVIVAQDKLISGNINLLHIDAGNIPPAEILVKSNLGVLYSKNDQWYYYDNLSSVVTFYVYHKSGESLELLNETKFVSQVIPNVYFRVGNGMSRQPLFELKNQREATVSDQYNLPLTIEKFTFQIIRKDESTGVAMVNIGSHFTDAIVASLATLNVGDNVLLSDIYVKMGEAGVIKMPDEVIGTYLKLVRQYGYKIFDRKCLLELILEYLIKLEMAQIRHR